jgi:hypothetical protein
MADASTATTIADKMIAKYRLMVGALESRNLRITTTTPAPTAITAARLPRSVELISIYDLLIGAA